jgi:thiol:disulfide interchange protein DsbD
MSNISKVFGVVMLAIAIYMLNSVINAHLYMFLLALLFIVSSIYLKSFEPVKTSWQMFIKGFGITIFLIGFFLLVGVLSGATNPFLPLEKFTQLNNISNSIKNNFYKVTSIDELNEVLSKHRGKKVMLDFYATWCTSCKELEHITFKDTKVQHYLKDYILIQADITKNSVQQRELSKKYGVFGPPVIIFFDKNHNIVRKIVGYKKPSEFLQYLR